jgi:hypothetical protein
MWRLRGEPTRTSRLVAHTSLDAATALAVVEQAGPPPFPCTTAVRSVHGGTQVIVNVGRAEHFLELVKRALEHADPLAFATVEHL